MFKLVFLSGGLIAFVIYRIQLTIHRRKVDAGGYCVGCDSRDVEQTEAGLECNECGYLTSNEYLNMSLSAHETRALDDAADHRF